MHRFSTRTNRPVIPSELRLQLLSYRSPTGPFPEACWKAFYQWAQITSEEIKRLEDVRAGMVDLDRVLLPGAVGRP